MYGSTLVEPLLSETCLSKGTGSAFQGGEFAEHGINSCVNLNERENKR
jgi:hypothetical protein